MKALISQTKMIAVIVLLLLTAGCRNNAPGGGHSAALTVFAAASLTEAFTEIGDRFEAEHLGVEVVLNFAGSQQLAQQLLQGAPAEVYASANQAQMDQVVTSGRAAQEQVQVMIHNRLVVIYPAGNPGAIHALGDLAAPGKQLVFAAAQVPVGAYTLEFLAKAAQSSAFDPDYPDKVIANVVSYEENVKAVLSKVELGEADAGIVYSSDAVSATDPGVGQLAIPAELNVTGDYTLAPIADSAQPELAGEFIDFVLSTSGQEILASYGFIPLK